MRLFNRSDLGRLYLSPRRGLANFNYVGDGSIDGVASATTVSYVGQGALAGKKSWTGTVTARPAHQLVAAAATPELVDLLVLYGNHCDIVQQVDYLEAILVEGVAFTADQYTALTALTSAQRAIVSSTHTFNADNVVRVPAVASLTRTKNFTGAVVALAQAGPRLYALVAAPVGGGTVTLRLAWTESPAGGAWNIAELFYGTFSEPSTLSPAGTWAQCGMAVQAGRIYISTVADFIWLDEPLPGMTALYPAPVRPAPYAPSGSPDQACRVVGLYAGGDAIYAGTVLGQVWRVAATGTVLTSSVGGTSNRAFCPLDGGEQALVSDTAVRVVGAGGRRRDYSGWSGNARYALGSTGNLIVATLEGKLWAAEGDTAFTELWNLGGALIALARVSGNLYYAIAATSNGSQLYISVNGGRSWTKAGDPYDGICLLPTADGKCLTGGQVGTSNRSTGPVGITVSSSGLIAATVPSEQLIVSPWAEGYH